MINPSGGLISKGHPLGATGLAQCAEICWQLRGESGPRQVAHATVGLTHNLGLGGATVVGLYRRPAEWRALPMKRHVSGAMGACLPRRPRVLNASPCYPFSPVVCLPCAGFSDAARAGSQTVAAAAAAAPAAGSDADNPSAGSSLKSAPLFDAIADGVRADGPALAKKVNGVIQFNIKPDGVWTVSLKKGAEGAVHAGAPKQGKPDLTLTVSDDDFVKLADGKLNAQTAFMQGKVKLKGNMGIAMKLQSVLAAAKPRSKL